MFLPCLFPSLSSPNLIILRVSEYITLLKILLIYYIKFFNFGVAFSGLLSLIKILNINFNYFTRTKILRITSQVCITFFMTFTLMIPAPI